MRLLILIALVYILYRVIRGKVAPVRTPEMQGGGRAGGEIEDDMVQDPQCGLWLTRRNSVALHKDGREYHFCSEECRDRFVESSGRN